MMKPSQAIFLSKNTKGGVEAEKGTMDEIRKSTFHPELTARGFLFHPFLSICNFNPLNHMIPFLCCSYYFIPDKPKVKVQYKEKDRFKEKNKIKRADKQWIKRGGISDRNS